MDEQEKQRSDSQENASDDGTKRRNSRRRNRRRRSSRPLAEGQQQDVQATEQREEEPRPPTGNAAKPKRRNAPRRSAMPDVNDGPAEVVRARAPQIAPLQPMRLREIDETDTSEPTIGCPMLSRTRIGIPFRGGQRVARCSKGWAIHDEDEVLLCMHTPTAAQCWKEHPEHLEALVERLRPMIEAELASN